MIPEMESPALGVRGNPEGDFAAGEIDPDNNVTRLFTQAEAKRLQAISEFAIAHHKEDDLRELLNSLLVACFQIEHAISWRKVHGGGTA